MLSSKAIWAGSSLAAFTLFYPGGSAIAQTANAATTLPIDVFPARLANDLANCDSATRS